MSSPTVRIDERIYSALNGYGVRAYPNALPQEFAAYPAAVFTIVGGGDEFHLGGMAGIRRRLVQIDAWGEKPSEASVLMESVRAAMLAATEFTVNAVDVSGAPTFEPDTRLHRESLEFVLWFDP